MLLHVQEEDLFVRHWHVILNNKYETGLAHVINYDLVELIALRSKQV